MADVYYECLNNLIQEQKYMIFKEQQANSKIQYQKQNLPIGKNTLQPYLDRLLTTLPPSRYILIKGTTTVPPIFIEFSDTKDTWYTTNPISLKEGYITLVGDGDQVTNDKPNVNGAIFLKKTMVPANAPVTVPVQPNRIISKEVTQIFKKVLADPLPWEPNQWIELGEEQRTRNGNIILKDGRPLIEFWYINPTTKQSVYVLPEGGVIRDLAVSSSLGHELENLRNRLSARETTATQDANLTMASIVNNARTLEEAQVAVKKGVEEAFIAKYSTHPQIKEAYERLVTPSSTPTGTLDLAVKYFKMLKMGVPLQATIQKVNIASDLNNDQKENIIAQLQGKQRGGLQSAPTGLGALFAQKTPKPPTAPSPQPPSANSQATTLNEAGMGQLQDLVRQINNNAAYDVIDPTNPHELFICITGSCSVKPKYSESVLKVVTAGVTSTVIPESKSTSAKLTINDFIEIKDIIDRASLIGFMKSTYKVDGNFNEDIQQVFPSIEGEEIIKAVAEYEAKKLVTPKVQPKVPHPTTNKLPSLAQIKRNEQTRHNAANVVSPFEKYTQEEVALGTKIDALKLLINELPLTLLANKGAIIKAAEKGLVQVRHVREIIDTKNKLQNAKDELLVKENTIGRKEKIAFMTARQKLTTNSEIVELPEKKGRETLYGSKKLPEGWTVTLDPIARTAIYINGDTQMPPEGKTLPFGWKIVNNNGVLVYMDNTGNIKQAIGGRRYSRKQAVSRTCRKNNKRKSAKGTRRKSSKNKKTIKKYRR